MPNQHDQRKRGEELEFNQDFLYWRKYLIYLHLST
jgi:hypothetical protein